VVRQGSSVSSFEGYCLIRNFTVVFSYDLIKEVMKSIGPIKIPILDSELWMPPGRIWPGYYID